MLSISTSPRRTRNCLHNSSREGDDVDNCSNCRWPHTAHTRRHTQTSSPCIRTRHDVTHLTHIHTQTHNTDGTAAKRQQTPCLSARASQPLSTLRNRRFSGAFLCIQAFSQLRSAAPHPSPLTHMRTERMSGGGGGCVRDPLGTAAV